MLSVSHYLFAGVIVLTYFKPYCGPSLKIVMSAAVNRVNVNIASFSIISSVV